MGYNAVFTRGFDTTSVAAHLTLNHGFPFTWLGRQGASIFIGSKEPLAEYQRHSPLGEMTQAGIESGTSRIILITALNHQPQMRGNHRGFGSFIKPMIL